MNGLHATSYSGKDSHRSLLKVKELLFPTSGLKFSSTVGVNYELHKHKLWMLSIKNKGSSCLYIENVIINLLLPTAPSEGLTCCSQLNSASSKMSLLFSKKLLGGGKYTLVNKVDFFLDSKT